jgi:hypothetical protein
MSSDVDLAKLSLDDFTPQLGAIFNMDAAGAVVPLRLVKAEASGGQGREGGAFSLLFAAPAGPWLPQAIYRVVHPTRGTMDLFLVPIGPIAEGNGYQAVFA